MITLTSAQAKYGKTPALTDFTADFAAGKINVLVGGDGAGKTTILRLLSRPHLTPYLSGNIPARNQIGYQPETSGTWPGLTVRDNLEFVAATYKLEKKFAASRTALLLAAAGLQSAKNRLSAHLSGGMRQKLGVIMAMLPLPELLLLDEPTTGVDQDSRSNLWELITQAGTEGSTVIFSTTYLDEAARADQVFLLDAGHLLAAGTPAEVSGAAPGKIWKIPSEVAAVKLRDDPHIWRRGKEIYYWTADSAGTPSGPHSAAAVDLELATIATLLSRRPKQDLTPDSPGTTSPEKIGTPAAGLPTILAQTKAVSRHFGDFTVLENISIQIHAGEIVGLIGGNGAGKTTLVRTILGLDSPNSGSVRLFGKKPNRDSRQRIGYVPQSLGLYATLTAVENFKFQTQVFGRANTEPWQSLPEIFGNRPIGSLPLGAKRNLAVQCALSHQPELLILDEPTSGMDALSRANLWKILQEQAAAGTGILITTHYPSEALQCDRLVHLAAGKIISPTTKL